MEPEVALKEGKGPVDDGVRSIKDGAALVVDGVTANGSPKESVAKLTGERLAAIEDEEALDRMLDETSDFEERKLIRAAMRELRKKKRAQREQERSSRQLQKEEQKARPAGGDAAVAPKKAEKLPGSGAHSAVRSQISSSTCNKKVGSVFERQDDGALRGGSGGLKELERRQAERRKELMKPKSAVPQTRQAMIQKLERESAGTGQPVSQVCRISRSPGSGVPNSKNVKQMLLDWCRAKTYSYENVSIQNFSSSWSDGLAFCALVHHFFPHAFDYSALSPADRRHNFETAFNAAEKLADCPALLDVEDMVRMREPDWKCVYTYIQEFYRSLVEKGLVKTKKSS